MAEEVFAREVLRNLEVKDLVRDDDDDDDDEIGSMGTSSFSLGEAILRQILHLEIFFSFWKQPREKFQEEKKAMRVTGKMKQIF